MQRPGQADVDTRRQPNWSRVHQKADKKMVLKIDVAKAGDKPRGQSWAGTLLQPSGASLGCHQPLIPIPG